MRGAALILAGLLLAYADFAVGLTTVALLVTDHRCGDPFTFGNGVTFAVASLAFWPVTLAVIRFASGRERR